MTNVFWPGLIAVFVMYALVFLVGIWAGRQAKIGTGTAEELLLAGRSLPLWVGLLTMTATWVGGGYINGTAELTFSSGMLWGSQAGLGYATALVIGGLFFAKKMRRMGYATLVDPLEARYGKYLAAVLMIPAVIAEVFWSAAILVALGTTFGTVIGIELVPAVLISSSVAIVYTVFGGLRAVAYTDVIQLFLILGGLGLAIPFAIQAAGGMSALAWDPSPPPLGEALSYADWSFLLILGGIPWNVYFQRVLSARDEDTAARLSVAAGVLCALMAIPPILLGLAANGIDWTALAIDAGLPPDQLAKGLAETPASVLPYTLRYAVPQWVGVLGMGAVAAAVMSSVDSSILSGASLVAWNGYRRLFEPDLNGARLTRLVQILIAVLGVAATAVALTVGSVSALWFLCGDIIYCVLFPQLTLALFDPKANRMGAASGLVISVFLRLGGGDATLGLPALLPYPDFGIFTDDYQFPFRTLAMAAGMITALLVARLTTQLDPPRSLEAA